MFNIVKKTLMHRESLHSDYIYISINCGTILTLVRVVWYAIHKSDAIMLTSTYKYFFIH